MSNNKNKTAENIINKSRRFGTFSGVFTPSMLTILGVIMYLRLGWVVGNAGLLGTFFIITLSCLITFLTSLSVSSIATDRKVRTGGAYYMISRSLGIESGGAIGIPLYIAQAFSVPLYTIGFAESVSLAFPGVDQRTVGIAVTIFVALLAIKSAKIAIKAQYLIMAVIAASLISLLIGGGGASSIAANEVSASINGGFQPDFWRVFAVFFPAVTGIMAGINMSGDLRNPSKSIPVGTLAAVGTGFVIYMFLAAFLYFKVSTDRLIQQPLVMFDIARWGWLILAGIWGATLSSAIGSILGAPRVLQALARDGVLPRSLRWLGKGSGGSDEPRYGTFLTLIMVLVLVYVGDLNMIAPILTMFFLATYLVLNFAAGVENFLQNPSFRPAFKVHWIFSMLGAIGCITAMFLVNPVATVIAAFSITAIYVWLERRKLESTWGDVRRGVWMMLVRMGLLQLDRSPDPRNWRPNILTLSGAPTKRWHLIEFADMLTNRKGMFTVATVLPYDSRDARQKSEMETVIKEYLDKRNIPALVRLISAPDPFTGAEKMVEVYGLGPVVPNTILLGGTEREDEEVKKNYFKLIENIYHSGKNVVIFNQNVETPLDLEPPGGKLKKIDIWWGGLKGNGGLMLIFADSLRFSPAWRNSVIRLKLVVENKTATETARKNLRSLLDKHNVKGAEYEVIDSKGRSFDEIFRESSRTANIIFKGMAGPGKNYAAYYDQMSRRIAGMPSTVFVLAGKNSRFSEVLNKEQG